MSAPGAMAETVYRVVALTRRDLSIQLSYTFQFAVRMFAMLLSLAMFFFLGRLVGESPEFDAYQGAYFEFVLLGLVVVGFAGACVRAFNESIREAHANGTLEILLATATPLSTLMAGSLSVPLLIAVIEAATIFIVGWLVSGLTVHVGGLLLAVPLLLLTLGTFAAIGIFSAAVIVLTKRGDPFSALLLQASYLLAGVFFPVTVLPEVLQWAARLFPAYWGLQGMRDALLGDAGLAEVSQSLLVLVGFNVIMLPLAMWGLARALRFARVAGTLGNR